MPPKPVSTRIRIMNRSDIASGEHLNTIAGWNQTEADWGRFLDSSPNGCFVTEVDGRIVGTAATISYENRFAWIGMVLVDPEFRNMGIGTRLLQQAMEHLDRMGVSTMKLDATPLGKPIYSKLGFVSEYEIERWLLTRPVTVPPSPPVVTSDVDEAQLAAICALDREVFGADRSFLLRSLHELAPDLTSVVWSAGIPQGYALGRKGRFADHLCPCVAMVERTARQFL